MKIYIDMSDVLSKCLSCGQIVTKEHICETNIQNTGPVTDPERLHEQQQDPLGERCDDKEESDGCGC